MHNQTQEHEIVEAFRQKWHREARNGMLTLDIRTTGHQENFFVLIINFPSVTNETGEPLSFSHPIRQETYNTDPVGLLNWLAKYTDVMVSFQVDNEI